MSVLWNSQRLPVSSTTAQAILSLIYSEREKQERFVKERLFTAVLTRLVSQTFHIMLHGRNYKLIKRFDMAFLDLKEKKKSCNSWQIAVEE